MKDKLSNLLIGIRIIVPSITWCACLKYGRVHWIMEVCLCNVYGIIKGVWCNNLLIAKLGSYDFKRVPPSFKKSCLSDRQQVRANNNFSSWEKIITGVPQGSILGTLLWNIFINDFFLCLKFLFRYLKHFVCFWFGFNQEKVKDILRTDFDAVTLWFYENYMILNAEKCHFTCLGKNTTNETFIFKDLVLKYRKEQKILGVL